MKTISKNILFIGFLAGFFLLIGSYSQADPSSNAKIKNSAKILNAKTFTPKAAKSLSGMTKAEATPNPILDFKIVSAKYLGQGRVQAEVRNDGNFTIPANRLRIKARYYIHAAMPMWPRIVTQAIPVGQTETIEINGLGNEGECYNLTSIDINVTDPVTNMDRYYDLRNFSLSNSVSINEAGFSQGFFRVDLQNTASYRVKLKIIIQKIEIWDIAKPQGGDDGNFFEQAWDVMTGGVEFDSSGLQPEARVCTANNILLTPVEISKAPWDVNPNWAVPITNLQNAIRAKCPNANFSRYSQIIKKLTVKVYTENMDACPARKNLATHFISEGGRQTPLFSW